MLFLRCLQQGRVTPLRLATRHYPLNYSKGILKKFQFQFQSPSIRFASTATTSSPPITGKPIYPARLLVYHAGTGRTVFIGCLKVTTIFLFAFFGLIVAPAQLAAPTLPYWRFASTLATGVLPLLFVSFTTAPFVTYIHLRLPAFARNSREQLTRYLRTLPATAEVDITTITLIGRPRVQKLRVNELQAVEPRLLNVANFKRTTTDETRPWWAGRGQRSYAIGEARGRAREGWAWDVVAEAIRTGRVRGAAVAGKVGQPGIAKTAEKSGALRPAPAAKLKK